MPVYEFECARGHITEELVPMGTKHTKCTKWFGFVINFMLKLFFYVHIYVYSVLKIDHDDSLILFYFNRDSGNH